MSTLGQIFDIEVCGTAIAIKDIGKCVYPAAKTYFTVVCIGEVYEGVNVEATGYVEQVRLWPLLIIFSDHPLYSPLLGLLVLPFHATNA